MQWYAGKRVFITGGSSGIGRATAKLLASFGAHVVIGARGKQRVATHGQAEYGGLDQALDEMRAIGRQGTTLDAVSVDITDKRSVAAAKQQVLDRLGGLDILINNAGAVRPGYIQETEDDVFDAMMQVNYFGTVNVTRAFLPDFVEQRAGHICNVSSLLGFLGIFGYTAYAASKFAVTGFTDCLRQELLPHNVAVSIVFPPDTDTPQFHEENRIKPPETKAVAGNVKALKADEVAQTMLSGIAAGKYRIVPGLSCKFAVFMYRHFPWMVNWVMDSDLKKAVKNKPSGQAAPS